MRSFDYSRRKNEQGVVSLLTVIFFMVFISLIVVGFITIVITDQRQTIDNDLSASALAAARSGIEDGKRLLMYCQTHSDFRCDGAINSQDNCDAFNNGTQAYLLAKELSVPLDDNGEGATGGATAYQQYFTCLTIQTKTESLSTPLEEGTDYIQHLKTVPPFKKLQLEWSGAGNYADRNGVIAGWPIKSNWRFSAIQAYVPVIRLQTIPYTSLTDLNTIEAATRTVYIVPCGSGCPSTTNINAIDLRQSIDPAPTGGLRPAGDEAITYAKCTISPGASYTCSVNLDGYDSSTSQYYVRASVLYGSTNLKITPYDDAGKVELDNVQPWIDVTGRTNDVFKRVRAQVSYQPTVPLPQNALESAAPICKIMIVTNDQSSSSYGCN